MKKSLKVIGIVLGIIVVLGIIFFAIDYTRVQKQEKPIFCIQNPAGMILDGGTIEYFGLGYKVIDFNTLAGFDDMKIGTWFMDYNDFQEEIKESEKRFEEEIEEYKKRIEEEMKKEEYSFLGKVIESTSKYIIVEPNENEEIRKSADKISIGLGENNDTLYEIGTNIKITYDGTVMESYPAQVNATKIELKSADNFEIIFKERQQTDSYNRIYAILDKSETDKYNYSIYAYEGSVNIVIDEQEYTLREALLENKITMEEVIAKANKDFPDAITYDDGGSVEYHYENYTIIKFHTLDGNRDVYIGTKDMTINDL